MKRILFLIYFFCIALILNAAKVDTLDVYSSSMSKYTKACVVTPDNYTDSAKAYPVLYLLPGYRGTYAVWVNNFPGLMEYADQYNMILVGVDAGLSSWYFDSPIDSTMKYETYVTKELIGFIDKTFNTIKGREGRAVTGLSMGGHGALYLTMRHQDVFGAAGSMSGGVDFRRSPMRYDLAKRLGDQALYPENWEKNTVLAQLYLCKEDYLAIIIDCGIEDGLITVNRALHERMLYLNIPHDYIERPGRHSYEYWTNSLQYQLLFFNNFFNK